MGWHKLASALVIDWLAYVPFRAAFEQLLDPELYTLEWLDGKVVSGEFRLFKSGQSAILCSLRTFPTGYKEMHVEAAVGELRPLTGPIIAAAEEWAKQEGCKAIRIESREGWLRVMGSQGYQLYQTAIRKEIA